MGDSPDGSGSLWYPILSHCLVLLWRERGGIVAGSGSFRGIFVAGLDSYTLVFLVCSYLFMIRLTVARMFLYFESDLHVT